MLRHPIPPSFRSVRAATPDSISLTLAELASDVPADQAIVELGVFQGWTALMMAWGATHGHGAHVWGFDAWDLVGNTYGPPFTDTLTHDIALTNIHEQGYAGMVTLTQEFSAPAGQRWKDEPHGYIKVGLLFVDGDHSYIGAQTDVVAWAENLAPDAVIAADDYGHPDWPGVAQAMDGLVLLGVLEPLQIFHERLAVTRLTGDWRGKLAEWSRTRGGMPPAARQSA